MVALRFATVLRAFGRSGSGGGLKDDEAAGLAVVVAFDPVRPGGGECFVSRLLLGSAAADCEKGRGQTHQPRHLFGLHLSPRALVVMVQTCLEMCPPHHTVTRWPIVAVGSAADIVKVGWRAEASEAGSCGSGQSKRVCGVRRGA